MEEKKYELTDETIDVDGHILHRIKAIRNFGDIKVGEIGGFIEKESDLSHNGKCWVYEDARVFGDAFVYGNARVFGNGEIYSNARVSGDAEVYDNAKVFGNAEVCDNAEVYGDARVSGNAEVCDNAEVYGNAYVSGDARVFGNADVCDNARVSGNACVCDSAAVYGDSIICNAKIRGYAKINHNGCINLNDDYITFDRFGSRLDTTTMFRCSDGVIRVSCGCFSGTLKEFRNKVGRIHGNNKYAKEYEAIIKVAKIHFGIKRL